MSLYPEKNVKGLTRQVKIDVEFSEKALASSLFS